MRLSLEIDCLELQKYFVATSMFPLSLWLYLVEQCMVTVILVWSRLAHAYPLLLPTRYALALCLSFLVNAFLSCSCKRTVKCFEENEKRNYFLSYEFRQLAKVLKTRFQSECKNFRARNNLSKKNGEESRLSGEKIRIK